jgi:glycosyltransferase involved in cell wall biosynthesis
VLDSILKLKEKHQDLRVIFVGDTLSNGDVESAAYGASFRLAITEKGLETICILLGNRDKVEDVYPACNFTILASNFEGTPNCALESMACGVPVVATKVGDNDRIIIHEGTGLLVEPGNAEDLAAAISRLMRDQNLLAEMSRKCRDHITQKFATHVLAAKLGRIYRELNC